MPFQPMNFSNIAPLKSPMADLVQTLAQGYQAGQLPATMERQKKREELANQLSGIQAKFAEPMAKANLNLLNSQSQKAIADALKQRMVAQIFSRLGGGSPQKGNTQQEIPQQEIPQSIIPSFPGAVPQQESTIPESQTRTQPTEENRVGFADASIAMTALGQGKPQIVDIDDDRDWETTE